MNKNLFRAGAAVGAVLFALLMGAGQVAAQPAPPREGVFGDSYVEIIPFGETPEAAFTELQDGEEIERHIADFEGQLLVVNFWATWCKPCIEEMPELNALQTEHGGDDLQVLTVSNDRGGAEEVLPFYEDYGLEDLGVYLDPKGELARDFQVRGLPTTFIVDRQGQVVGRIEGIVPWNAPEAHKLLDFYLEGRHREE
ncbi:TlpA disulfide reductase family protein [Fodinicurvata halophila]|uniref:TlpA disulfide reductase family protein n=1 Tax=Fodinicurvata halophila TaxID=1419723 RepID=A0ABV8UKM3_9PROT